MGIRVSLFYINWFIKEATPTWATRKARRALERERLCAGVSYFWISTSALFTASTCGEEEYDGY